MLNSHATNCSHLDASLSGDEDTDIHTSPRVDKPPEKYGHLKDTTETSEKWLDASFSDKLQPNSPQHSNTAGKVRPNNKGVETHQPTAVDEHTHTNIESRNRAKIRQAQTRTEHPFSRTGSEDETSDSRGLITETRTRKTSGW